ncbi:Multidrug export protein MepA [BD1-7 clade bacterium]|uniref:Multidrug-efflux transporter n=1 Tax=BD1-7 clade bacterium TaxID=2029982 RepID=A0A5S9PH81_9GAMM|nr:Multidrug export protein MepA [BD1-7 clade bacterium]
MSATENNRALDGAVIPTFFYYVVPSIIGLVALTTATLVDGIFVGNGIGSDALAAISIMMPWFTLLTAVSLMLAIGGSVRAGKYVGEDNLPAASAVFSKTLITAALVNLLLAALSLLAEPLLFAALNTPAELQPAINAYFDVIRWVLVIQLTTMVLYYFVRADGHPMLATIALIVGATTNIVLDYWFIMIEGLGLQGAAIATAIAQCLQLAVLCTYFLSRTRTLSFSLQQQQWREMLYCAFNGVSEFINEISVGLLFLLLNWLLIDSLGIDGLAAFSVINYLIFLSIMLCYGVADALHLLVSQNFGARNFHRIKQFSYVASACVMALGVLIITGLFIAKTAVIDLFLDVKAQHVAELAASIALVVSPLFLVNGTNILISCYLTAIHQPRASAMIALLRSLLLPAGLLVLFYFAVKHSTTLKSFHFLAALPTAEWMTFLIAVTIYCRYQHLEATDG